jgi:hypothetical protein
MDNIMEGYKIRAMWNWSFKMENKSSTLPMRLLENSLLSRLLKSD